MLNERADVVGKGVEPRSRFFAHHPRTYPKELTLSGAPGTFGGPFTQNDMALNGMELRFRKLPLGQAIKPAAGY
jgi:hypothetical protein